MPCDASACEAALVTLGLFLAVQATSILLETDVQAEDVWLCQQCQAHVQDAAR